ncbi:polyprenyl synthetase family protein [Streptomyces clavuligerus]|uniref:polyprenyl synthetase family protein n=2 Tax=Streptomyces clavuligerus TaxID=1901 RepID=UPI0027DC35A5|nr:polyprenyl synthetase family protein [Streptomyces clavuligerus]
MSGIESPVTNTVPDSLNGHPWGVLIPWDQQVREDTLAVIDRACPPGSRLHDPVRAIVTTALQQQGPLSNRLFALAVLGAISGNPAPAVPVAVASTLWFAGTEALDDLVDAAPGDHGSAHELLIGGVLCLGVLPEAAVEGPGVPAELARGWRRDLGWSTVAAGAGQLDDTARDSEALTWERVMRAYTGKTGAGYGRDARMAARAAVTDPRALEAWTVLGQLLGVLRQVHNDNADVTPETDEDLANGTPTLLLAHALASADPRERNRMHTLRTAARADLTARAELRALLHCPPVVDGYRRRVGALHSRARNLLDHLADASPYRDAIGNRIAQSALLGMPEPAGAGSE